MTVVVIRNGRGAPAGGHLLLRLSPIAPAKQPHQGVRVQDKVVAAMDVANFDPISTHHASRSRVQHGKGKDIRFGLGKLLVGVSQDHGWQSGAANVGKVLL